MSRPECKYTSCTRVQVYKLYKRQKEEFMHYVQFTVAHLEGKE
jgi:hypothetical protein